MTAILPIEFDVFDDTINLYTSETDAVWDVVQSVASVVAPNILANIGRAVHEYHESAGLSEAAALDNACADIPANLPVRLVRLNAYEALALGVALQRYAQQLLAGDAA